MRGIRWKGGVWCVVGAIEMAWRKGNVVGTEGTCLRETRDQAEHLDFVKSALRENRQWTRLILMETADHSKKREDRKPQQKTKK